MYTGIKNYEKFRIFQVFKNLKFKPCTGLD